MPAQATPIPEHLGAADKPWAPDLFPKQFDVVNDRHRRLLVCGPRKTGKSIAICHKIFHHLWNTNGAVVGLFTTSYKVATDGGSWTDLIKYAYPQWEGLEAGDSPGDDPSAYFHYTTFIRGDEDGGPKLDAKSRTPFFRIQNRFGGESECRLFSVDNENEIEAKTKQLRFSGVWVIELSTFKTRKIMEMTVLCLRAHGVPLEDQFWIADTNPAEEGREHWSYKVFYVNRVDPAYPDKQFQSMTGLIEIFLDDNTKLNAIERSELENLYRNSHDEYQRFVLGIWPDGPVKRREVFADLLTPVHFPAGPIDIPRTTETLITGWDMGSINSAFIILCRHVEQGISFWLVLAEIVLIDFEITTADFTLQCLDKIIAINEFYKSHWPLFPGFLWRHWSDNSSTAFWKPQIGAVDAAIVYDASKHQIELQGVSKPDGSVEEDTKMLRTLLREGRLFVGDNCPHTREMLQKIKRGSRGQVDATDKLKHVFDALRYPIRAEWVDDLQSSHHGSPVRQITILPLR